MLLLLAGQGAIAVERNVNASYQATVTVSNNSYDAYIIPLNDKDDTLTVSMFVTSGSDVDIFLVTESEYIKYKSQQAFFYYMTPFSKMSTSSDAFSMQPKDTAYGTGTYVLIVDNQLYTSQGASPTGSVKYSMRISAMGPTMMNSMMINAMWIAAIVIVALVVVFVAYMIYDRKRERETKRKEPQPPTQILFCPTCAMPTIWVPKYQRYYCKGEKKYLPKGIPPPLT
jgi:hypothetical protein